jgi:regulator of protease activity HflC (stomatin/prohibitin superfamily)
MNIASLFQGIATLAWLALVAVVVFVVLGASRNRPVRGGGTFILVTGLLALVLTSVGAGIVFINPEERGVVISAVSPTGYRSQALDPGLRWIIPFAEYVKRYPISRQTYTMSASTGEGQLKGDDSITARTKDGQQIFVDASVIYTIDPVKVVQVHIAWQDRYQDELVRPQSRGIIRDVVSQYNVEEVVSTKRIEMVQTITDTLKKKLDDNGLTLVDFVLRNLTFSPEYAASVEQKQIAEQQAQQAKFVVESKKQEADQAREVAKGAADAVVTRAEGDAKARVIQAQAEAEALGLVAKVLKENPNLIEYQYVTKLSPNVQIMLLPNNAPFLFNLKDFGPTPSTTVTDSTPALPTPEPTAVPTQPQPTPTAKP